MLAAWATDIHFDHADDEARLRFCERVRSTKAKILILSGDNAMAGSETKYLTFIQEHTGCQIYFVLGNHDFYGGSIHDVRQEMESLTARNKMLQWLPRAGIISLNKDCALIGHDGWGDARYGEFLNSTLRLNDYVMIKELGGISNEERKQRLQDLGTECANYIRMYLPQALKKHQHVYFVTHVPPYPEICLNEGIPCNENEGPHFCCVASGEALREVMAAHSEKQLTVLCGHSHGGGDVHVENNIHCLNFLAEYRNPQVAQVFEF